MTMKTKAQAIHFKRRIPAIATLLILILGITLIGCSSTVLTRPMTKETDTTSKPPPALALAQPTTVRGIPYFLPTYTLDLSLESLKGEDGKHKDLQVKNTVRFVPDRTRGYLLDSRDQWHSRKVHEVKLKDGMLSLVTTEDENKLGEILSDLAASAANIVAFGAIDGAGPAVGALAVSGSTPPPLVPTPEEIAQILAMIPAGKFEFNFPEAPTSSVEVPGTDGLLHFTLTYAPVASINVAEPKVKSADGGMETGIEAPNPDGGDGGFPGIYSRVLRPETITIKFLVPKAKLLTLRLSMLAGKIARGSASLAAHKATQEKISTTLNDRRKTKKALEDQAKAIEETIRDLTKQQEALRAGSPEHLALGRQITDTRSILAGMLAQIDTTGTIVTELEAKESEAISAVTKATAALDSSDNNDSELTEADGLRAQATFWASIRANHPPAANQTETIAQRSSTVLVPDKDVTVQIPVTRTWFGVTKNSLILESGILTEYRTEKDSAGLAMVKMLYSVTEKIVELPAKIIQLRIDYSTKQKALADAEQAYAALRTEIATSKEPATDHAKEVQKLTLEKEILTLQKEIALLRSAIEKANTNN